MTPLLLLFVALAGGVGAGLRYAVDLAVVALVGARFPWGTLVVNVTGSFAIGLAVASIPDAAWLQIIATGLLGGYTTFSSVAAMSAALVTEGRGVAALLNALGTLVLTVLAAAGGLALGALF